MWFISDLLKLKNLVQNSFLIKKKTEEVNLFDVFLLDFLTQVAIAPFYQFISFLTSKPNSAIFQALIRSNTF